MAILGNNIIVYMGGTAIAGTKSDELKVDCETIKIASATNQDWEHIIAGRKSWSLNVSWLVLANTDVRKALQVGSTVTIKFKGRNATEDHRHSRKPRTRLIHIRGQRPINIKQRHYGNPLASNI